MNRVIVAILLSVLFFAGTAGAQVVFNTGSIFGKVVDANGGPLPGVSVTAETGGTTPKTLTTGPGGSYRFAALLPGTYSVTFSLQGFTEVRQEEVQISAAQNVNLDVTLKQTTEEVVVVTGAEPVVDTKKTQIASSYSTEYLEDVPSARDPWVILDQTPGIDVDRINVGGNQSGQQSVYTAKGGSFAQNGWSYDGVDITDPAAAGATPTYYDFDSFQEIQITTGGQDPAISTGGVVINFITKRGGNTWSGAASVYYDNDSLQGDNLDDELISQGIISPNRVDEVYEYGGDLGGPIAKDRAWIWGSYRLQNIKTFTILTTGGGGALQEIELEDVNLKGNIAYNTASEGNFQFLYGAKTFDGRLSFLPTQQDPNASWLQTGPTKMYKAEHTVIPNANLFFDAKFAYVDGAFNLDPVSGIGNDAQAIFRFNNDFYLENGWVFYHTVRPQYNFAADANYFKQNWAGGDHEFKFGFAYKGTSVTTSCQYGGDVLLYDYSTVGRGSTSAGQGLAKLRYLRNATYDINSWGAYAGDTWRMDRLTLNLGVRYDHHTASATPSTAPANSAVPDLMPPVDFGGNDAVPTFNNVSPRLGATYDVTGDGKTVVRGNYARFYAGLGPTPPTFIHALYAYAGIKTGYKDLNGDGIVTRDEIDPSFALYYSGGCGCYTTGNYFTSIGGFDVNNPGSFVGDYPNHRFIDPNLKSETTDEFLVGFERQLADDVSIAANYTYRKYDNLTDIFIPGIDQSAFSCFPLTVTAPTGETFTTNFCDISDELAVQDRYFLTTPEGLNRTYQGVEIVFNKRMSHNWMMRLSAELKDQKIHFDGSNSFQDPTSIGFYDDTWWAEQSTNSGSGGVFTGSRWGFKASGAYQFPADLTVGAYLKVIDGNVAPTIRSVPQNYYTVRTGAPLTVLLTPFDDFRLNTITYVDVRVEKGFNFGNYGRLAVLADIFNLFNANDPIRVERRANNARFRQTAELISPRIVRFGVRYNF